MKNIGKTFKCKTRQLNLAVIIMQLSSDLIWWIDLHMPQWVSGPLYRVYWLVDGLASALFARAYEGSIEEINDAWDHEDEDWLSPFQRMVADGKILPL